MAEKVVRTLCGLLCGGVCGIQVTVRDGQPVKVTGDPDCPTNRGTLCPKGANLLGVLQHPDRLKYPLKRVGGRGEGRWQQISWDEALDMAAQRLGSLKKSFGPESVSLWLGGHPRGTERAMVGRLAAVFGTPNVSSNGYICHVPRAQASRFTYGGGTTPDYEHPPRCVVVWGNNPRHTSTSTWEQIRTALKKGTRLIVIDPQDIDLARKADIWLRLRPGSDGFLALAMLKVIAEEGLYDREFVARWTVGFDRLQEELKGLSLSQLVEATWLPQAQIVEAARLYAQSRPAVIQAGNALDQSQDSFQIGRAQSILRAITGNLDIPGGELMPTPPPVLSPAEFMLHTRSKMEGRGMVGSQFKVAALAHLSPRPPLVKAILEGEPYPVKAVLCFGTNPMLTYPDSRELYQAFLKLDFLMVADLFMTPTAALADLVLPAAMHLEFPDLAFYGTGGGFLGIVKKVAEPPGEAWPDIEIVNELAKRLGLGQHFWPEAAAQALEEILRPLGLSPEAAQETVFLQGERGGDRKYLKKGFATSSGKVEVYSQPLAEMGYGPLPAFRLPPQPTSQYPLLLSSAKPQAFIHSSLRQVPGLRRISPDPVVELHPQVASSLGIGQGDWVYIETEKGRIKQKAAFNPQLDPRVVMAAVDWWFPEQEAGKLYGWEEANLNILTDSSAPCDPAMGSIHLRGVPCRLSRA